MNEDMHEIWGPYRPDPARDARIAALEAEVARLREALTKERKEVDTACSERFDVPPERDTEPLGYHAGWEACARSIADRILRVRAALTAPTPPPQP